MYLDFQAAKNLFEKYKIDVVDTEVAHSEASAKKAAERIGFPALMKLNSAMHKTEIGGIVTEIENHTQAANAFALLKKRAEKAHVEFDGVLVQKQLQGKEIIIGGKQDLQFGPVILFGLGGIFVELMGDVSLKIAPVTKKQAERMLKSIKGYALLKGMRGDKSVDMEKIIDAIVSVSHVLHEHPEIKELDLNPLIVTDKYCTAVDLRVIC